MSDLTHWKKLQNPNYLGAYSLTPGQDMALTIKSVQLETVVGTDGKKEECTVARFRQNVKPMILNVTNCRTIENIYGTPYIEEWAGKHIQVYAAKVKAFGEEVEALRIRPKEPTVKKKVLDQNYNGWEKALSAVSNGETTIDALKKKYTLPKECEDIMQEAIKNA